MGGGGFLMVMDVNMVVSPEPQVYTRGRHTHTPVGVLESGTGVFGLHVPRTPLARPRWLLRHAAMRATRATRAMGQLCHTGFL